MSGASGRHRKGAQPGAVVVRRNWDSAKKAAAIQLDMLEPAWTVLYGAGTRRFLAIPLWNAPESLRVEASTVEEVLHLMRQAEVDAMASRGRHRAGVA